MDDLLIYEFKPLFLTLDRVGPFQNFYKVDFTDNNNHPCNFFMMVSPNGLGKTTSLEVFSCLMDLLGKKAIDSYGHEDLDKRDGRAQLDFWVRLRWQGKNISIILSVLAGVIGEETFLNPWSPDQLQTFNAESWHKAGFRSSVPGRYENIALKSDDLLQDLLATLRAAGETAPENNFLQPSFHLPTVLYFSAYRDIPYPNNDNHDCIPQTAQFVNERSISTPNHWNYQPVHAFEAHSAYWKNSLDNLLVWLKWLDNGSFEKAQEWINKELFDGTPKLLKGVRRNPPEAIIDTGNNQTHRLDRLSSGEKSLAYLFLRMGAHSTRNTIILIDEMDIHLHIRWQHRLYNALEQLAKDNPGFTVILTTHSIEILQRFTATMGQEREGLFLGGELIEETDLR
ncbi:AAA family ATPase [Methylomonas methanica]|uniref:AAA ATPase n=1 Tax=Methylomonas methanica (strain DSM 25384 / MC09) TaxID=857087 RepID=F9ZYW0_METMM|nr:AAA family ATPase [Methylomonas methanica]AEF98656.1 AAA ATPase [Methylomonas methanica MC09]